MFEHKSPNVSLNRKKTIYEREMSVNNCLFLQRSRVCGSLTLVKQWRRPISFSLELTKPARRGYLHTGGRRPEFHNELLSSLAVFPKQISKLGPIAVKVMLKFFPLKYNHRKSPLLILFPSSLPNALPSLRLAFITKTTLGTTRAKQF
jgi:hypothetical protein